ncbi:conserved Plasmodium protein, unknown function [Plasmodium chabaudi chabaudi]|uniref:AATF leucine zipper-containing domain-containing protein n=1 Tax=Plasmodium chabaudi chabaudi TaxID=31271 RepID=A0A4V0K5H6_PLACU|nr:conserved Plasmodium protein, unknown function [Plasmodium chabaudi chabaudi]VTZ67630.1 conserved Plasmodium protein, unknown function [Plasmodium chabaudi chabaudi]|eukprot:XP_016653389.1 conserved Plasmodium protein, unknown function [Plasmodium chabaudi chabaudi]
MASQENPSSLKQFQLIKKTKKKANSKIQGKKKKKKSFSTKGNDEKNKLNELYKLELKNNKKHKNNKYDSDDNSSDSLGFLNEYDDINEISKQVAEQVSLYKLLLRTRILTQKVLSLSNKLPLLPFVSCSELILNQDSNEHDENVENSNSSENYKNTLKEIQSSEQQIKDDIGELLSTLHFFLKKYFIKKNIAIDENADNQLNIICDEEDEEYYEKRKQLYDQNTTENEKKLFLTIDTWFKYSKKSCLNFFDIMHKITKISSIASLKTYEQPISSQINQVMFDLPSIIESAYPQVLSYNVIGEKIYEKLYSDNADFNLNKYIYDDEIYYKKFLLNAIENLKDNQNDNELLKSQKSIYKIKKKYNNDKADKGKIKSFDVIPKLANFMLPESRDINVESHYDYMDNPELVNVLLSSLFQD